MVGCEGKGSIKKSPDGIPLGDCIGGLPWWSSFMIVSDAPAPSYIVEFQGYPYNRLVLRATITRYRDNAGNWLDAPVTEPMDLQAGVTFPAQARIGSTVLAPVFTVVKQSTLPAGSYILDAPGFLNDAVDAINAEPGCDMTWTFDDGARFAMLPSFAYSLYEAISPSASIHFDSTSAAVLGSVRTIKPTLGIQYQY